jgi:hypothetical protein
MNTSVNQPTSTAAIVSLSFGIASWVLLPVLASIVAVIAGHMARGEIRRSNGTISGDGLALVGMILGYVNLAAALLFILALVFGVFAIAGLAALSGG